MEKTNKDRINKKKEPNHDCRCPGKDITKDREAQLISPKM